LGFVLGPPLFELFAAPVTTPGPPVIDSRALRSHLRRKVRVAGIVATARHTYTHDQRPLQFVTLEDTHGLVEVTLFPGHCPPLPYLTIGPYVAMGTVEDHHGVAVLVADTFERQREKKWDADETPIPVWGASPPEYAPASRSA